MLINKLFQPTPFAFSILDALASVTRSQEHRSARRRSWRAKRSSSSWRSKPWKPTRPSGSPPRRGRSRPRSKRTSRHGARCRKTCPRDARHPAPCACPTCRGALHRIGEDVTETLDSRRGGSDGSHRRLHVRRPPAVLLPGRDL